MVKDGSALARATSIGPRAATSLKSLQMRLVAFLATARRPAGRCRINAIEPEVAQFQRIHEHIDRANRIARGATVRRSQSARSFWRSSEIGHARHSRNRTCDFGSQ